MERGPELSSAVRKAASLANASHSAWVWENVLSCPFERHGCIRTEGPDNTIQLPLSPGFPVSRVSGPCQDQSHGQLSPAVHSPNSGETASPRATHQEGQLAVPVSTCPGRSTAREPSPAQPSVEHVPTRNLLGESRTERSRLHDLSKFLELATRRH